MQSGTGTGSLIWSVDVQLLVCFSCCFYKGHWLRKVKVFSASAREHPPDPRKHFPSILFDWFSFKFITVCIIYSHHTIKADFVGDMALTVIHKTSHSRRHSNNHALFKKSKAFYMKFAECICHLSNSVKFTWTAGLHR